MHRQFGDRLLSVVSPVRRYRCTNLHCGYEALLRKTRRATPRPIIAVAGLVAAVFAGALAMGTGLYLAAAKTTRSEARNASTSLIQYRIDSARDSALPIPSALPMAAPTQVAEPGYESTTVLGAPSITGELTFDFVPPLPGVAPAASRGIEPVYPR